jgi:hypothetical protein
VLRRVAQVTVDDQGALADLGEDHAEVGADEALAVAAVDAGDRQRGAARRAVEPAGHELAAQAAQRFREGRIGVDCTGDRIRQRKRRCPRRRIAELQGKRLVDVGMRHQPHPDRGFAKAQAGDPLLVEDQVDLVLPQLAVGNQDGAHHQRLARGDGLRVEDGFFRLRFIHDEARPGSSVVVGRFIHGFWEHGLRALTGCPPATPRERWPRTGRLRTCVIVHD